MVGKVAGLPSALNKINSHLTLPILQSLRRLNFRPIPFSLPYLRNIAKEITTFLKKLKFKKTFKNRKFYVTTCNKGTRKNFNLQKLMSGYLKRSWTTFSNIKVLAIFCYNSMTCTFQDLSNFPYFWQLPDFKKLYVWLSFSKYGSVYLITWLKDITKLHTKSLPYHLYPLYLQCFFPIPSC